MTYVKLDCQGLACPEPVIQTKNALEEGADNLMIRVDNEAARDNVSRFGQSRNCIVEVQADDGCFLVSIQTRAAATAKKNLNQPGECSPLSSSPENGIIHIVSSDSMGRGNDELGWALLQSYIRTINELTPLPEKIIFYNGGVKLVATGSGVIENLQKLQKQGVTILVCGTCLDFYKLKSALKVGHISNMYEIMSSMSEAEKLVSPF